MEKKTIYTNGVSVGTQLFDFLLTFNVNHPDGYQDDEYRVYMSPQHAKVLAMVLGENVKTYEEIFGAINLEANQEKLQKIQQANMINQPAKSGVNK